MYHPLVSGRRLQPSSSCPGRRCQLKPESQHILVQHAFDLLETEMLKSGVDASVGVGTQGSTRGLQQLPFDMWRHARCWVADSTASLERENSERCA